VEALGGSMFSVAGAGESHGPAITTIVCGCPPGLKLSREQVQVYLDRRRPGSNKLGTPRREPDKVIFLSGLYTEDHDALLAASRIATTVDGVESEAITFEQGYTTGEPIAAIVLSAAKRSTDYDQLAGPQGAVRPGHTDLVKHYQSQGFTDPRGGGRSSYRSTTTDVIGGSIARLFLAEHFDTAFLSSICRVGPLEASVSLADHVEQVSLQQAVGEDRRVPLAEIEKLHQRLSAGELHTIDEAFESEAAALISETRKQGDSIGAAIEVVGVNVPSLIGEPLYQSLKLRLMGTLGGLHAVQSCEMGSGLDVVTRKGSENNDPIRSSGYSSNHHGGLIGGITTGMPIAFRVGFKPTSTISLPQKSIRKDLEEIDFEIKRGRHDPCLGVRAGVTLESRMAIEVMDAVLSHQAKRVNPDHFSLF
jgi:chorismate synthase